MSKTERIVIHHIEGRRSERVAWLLEELGVPYELDFIQGDIFGSLLALEKHHEMRMAPIVHIGDVVMVESAAILEYLLSKYGKGSTLRPERSVRRSFPPTSSSCISPKAPRSRRSSQTWPTPACAKRWPMPASKHRRR